MVQLSPEIIKVIAQELDTGLKCFYHLKTGELVSFPDELNMYGDINEDVWVEDRAKVEGNPDDYLAFQAMESFESYRLMEDFIASILHDRTRIRFEEAIRRKKPFQQFKNLLFDYPDLRQQWFVFKEHRYQEYVQDQLDKHNHSFTEDAENG